MKMNNKVKVGVSFAIGMALFFMAKDLVTITNFSVKTVMPIIISSIIAGALGGFLFTWTTEKIKKSKYFKDKTKIKNESEE